MTANRTIGGRLDHRALAMLHRPTDPKILAREAAKLLALGLSLQDAAAALRMPVAEVAGLLAIEHQPTEETNHDQANREPVD
ncbi:MAG: hypothetical protein IT485_01835 [Gammaproteobacteria bacterium]|nr:hypothetical protein [Gammaproteobacteria bacterium]